MDHLYAPWRHAWITGGGGGSGDCLFCRVWSATGADDASLVIHRQGGALVMLNRFPYNGGHVMIVPRQHVGALDALPAGERSTLFDLAAEALSVLRAQLHPHGFNLGINEGSAAGAGIPGHLHVHVVPRWNGDTNFMSTVGETRVVSEDLDRARADLARAFAARTGGQDAP